MSEFLGHDEVHVWRADLDQDSSTLTELRSSLSVDEAARADRFAFDQLRNRFVAARGILRRLLGQYLDLHPSQLQFEYGAAGKPKLSGPAATRGLHFNVAHSNGFGLFAIARNREIGVDIECFRSIPDLEIIASRYFAPNEYAALHAIPPESRSSAFFHCWVRKEAFIKAIGEGLSHPLSSFEVSMNPNEPARLVWHSTQPTSRWSMWNLPVGDEKAAALVVEGIPQRIELFDWVWVAPLEKRP